MEKIRKIILSESEMPRQWYNIIADMPNKPMPPLHPVTRQPVGPADLAPIFPMELIKQEVSSERYIDIPDEVLDLYRTYRPAPLFRAVNLEKALGQKAKSTINMKAAIIQVLIKQTLQFRRLIITKKKE